MPVIRLETFIKATPQVCFDLSRDIDLHMESTKHTGETAVAGKTSGLIGLNETVTWRARHFGVRQTMKVKITAMQYPNFFADEMVEGAFKSFRHEHYFKSLDEGTLMVDVFSFASPLGIVGSMANYLFLTKYMQKLLIVRNVTIKHFAEHRK